MTDNEIRAALEDAREFASALASVTKPVTTRQAFIWTDLGGITSNWHDGGGVFVVADDLDAARAAVREHCAPEVAHVQGTPFDGLEKDPDYTMSTDSDPLVVVFPDAGCC